MHLIHVFDSVLLMLLVKVHWVDRNTREVIIDEHGPRTYVAYTHPFFLK